MAEQHQAAQAPNQLVLLEEIVSSLSQGQNRKY